MALQEINIGTSANDGSGDPLRTAMEKINDNFSELQAGYVKVTDLGSLGASETIDNANGPQQKGTLDASTLITLPAVAASATGWETELELVQNSTGGFLPLFVTASGDILKWDNDVAPSVNNIHAQPGEVNRFRFKGALDTVYGEFINPKDSGTIMTGAALIQLAILSFLGMATVSKRLPFQFQADEVQTTDATETTLFAIPVELNTTVIALSLVIGGRSTGAESVADLILSGWRRGSSGNVAEIGPEEVLAHLTDTGGAAAAITDVDTTNQLGRGRVTGEASETYNWAHYTFYFKVTQ